jgi:5-methyltetrahydropteroyltriglutamate--homocysteine methyltransferase
MAAGRTARPRARELHEIFERDPERGVGGCNVQDVNVESGEVLAERIRALRWLAPEQTLITTSCGLNHLPRHIALGKLEAMTAAKDILCGARL